MDAATAVSFSRIANKFLADAIERHPAEAEKEIERGVTQLGMHAVVINSHMQGEYLSDPKFWVIFAAAEAFDAPIYLHPNALPEHRSFKRSFSWRRAVAGRRLGAAIRVARLIGRGAECGLRVRRSPAECR